MRLLRALTAPWRAALLLAVTLIGLGYTPATVSNSAASMLSSCGRVVWRGITIAPTPSSPLKAAILNVTTDFDEVCVVGGWMCVWGGVGHAGRVAAPPPPPTLLARAHRPPHPPQHTRSWRTLWATFCAGQRPPPRWSPSSRRSCRSGRRGGGQRGVCVRGGGGLRLLLLLLLLQVLCVVGGQLRGLLRRRARGLCSHPPTCTLPPPPAPPRSYPHLESTLDWLLALYKFVFPFLVSVLQPAGVTRRAGERARGHAAAKHPTHAAAAGASACSPGRPLGQVSPPPPPSLPPPPPQIISMVARLSGGSATGEGTPHPQHQQQPHGQQQHEGEQGGGHGAWEEEEAQGAGQQVVQHRGGGGEDGSGRLRLAPRARSPRAPPLRLAPAPEAHADPRPAGGGGGGAGSTQLVRRESLSPVAAPGTPGAAGLLAAHPAFSGGLYSSSGGGGGGGGKEGAGGKQRGRQQQRVSDIHAYAR